MWNGIDLAYYRMSERRNFLVLFHVLLYFRFFRTNFSQHSETWSMICLILLTFFIKDEVFIKVLVVVITGTISKLKCNHNFLCRCLGSHISDEENFLKLFVFLGVFSFFFFWLWGGTHLGVLRACSWLCT